MTTLFRARALRGVRVRGYICPVRAVVCLHNPAQTRRRFTAAGWQLPMWFVGSALEQTEWFGTACVGREPARGLSPENRIRSDERERETRRFWTKGDFGLLGWRPVFVLVLLLPDDAPLITTPSSFGGTVW